MHGGQLHTRAAAQKLGGQMADMANTW
jgi:hypothetical protein